MADFFSLLPSKVTSKPFLPVTDASTVTFLIYSFNEISDAFVLSLASGRYTLTNELSTTSLLLPV